MVIKIAPADDEGSSLGKQPSSSSSSLGKQPSLSSSTSNLVKFFLFIVVGIVVLFYTDSIEIKNGSGGDQHEALPFSGAQDVELKTPVAPPGGKAVEDSPVATQPPPDPTSKEETKTNPSEKSDESSTNDAPVTPEDNSKRHVYKTRGRPMSAQDRQAMIDKWGSWTLEDHKQRSTGDFYKDYPNRDIPRSKFPANAWQLDKEYLSQFLPESLALVQRAQDAILSEYGQEEAEMFKIEFLEGDLSEVGGKNAPNADRGGWTTQSSWEGLKKRVMHAIMTEDTFIFAMGGHSAAAGHGNHFQQSYTLQVQWILEAVFARLGVRQVSRNFGNGGLGTVHNGIAAASVYGPDVDVLMWDSSMTEKESHSQDLFHRQALLGGSKVPVLWTLAGNVAKELYLNADADVGYPGEGKVGVPTAQSYEEIQAMPWAAQYVNCNGELKQICRKNEYNGTCWIERDDFTPVTTQKNEPGGRASWHPGNRKHQVRGRVLAFTFLQALREVLEEWKETEGYEVPDEKWHVTAHYENIRTKVKKLGPEVGSCHKEYENRGMAFICKYPMKTRTEFTPRAYPPLTNLRNLMPPEQAGLINPAEHNLYNPPDVFNPALHPPEGAVDVLSIVEAGIDFGSILSPCHVDEFYKKPKFESPPKVPIGKGISLETKAGDDFCDGSVDSFCSKGADQNCLLYGHNDGRNGLDFDGYSGWMVMNVPDLKNGYVVLKFESWRQPNSAFKTDGWTSVNNEGKKSRQTLEHRGPSFSISPVRSNSNSTAVALGEGDSEFDYSRSTNERSRRLKQQPPDFCDNFQFEYAIDGKVTVLDLVKFQELSKLGHIQRVVETLVLLDDPNYTGGQEKEVEIAVRMTGCARTKVFRVSHLYWS